MKTTPAVLVGLFSFGLSGVAMAQLDPAPADTAPAGVAPVQDTADYVQIAALPFIYRSLEIDPPGAGATVESSASRFGAVSPTVYFKAGWDRFVLRTLLGEAGAGAIPEMARLQAGFRLSDLLEIGPYLSGSRSADESAAGTVTTDSFFYFGPYARIAMALGSTLSLETEIRIGIGFGSEGTDPPTGPNTTADRGGFEVAVSGAIVKGLTSNIDYVAALGIAYNSISQEAGGGDVEISYTSVALYPLNLRYRF